jgi:hypothetical protein
LQQAMEAHKVGRRPGFYILQTIGLQMAVTLLGLHADRFLLPKLINAPWYISKITLHNDLRIPYVTEVIRTYGKKHKN